MAAEGLRDEGREVRGENWDGEGEEGDGAQECHGRRRLGAAKSAGVGADGRLV